MTVFTAMPPPRFSMLCAPGSAWNKGGGLASSSPDFLLQRLAAVTAQRDIAAVALGRCVLRPWHLVPLGTLARQQTPARGPTELPEGTSGDYILQWDNILFISSARPRTKKKKRP